MSKKALANVQDNFQLKTLAVDLYGPTRGREHAFVSAEQLDALRVGQSVVPASRHGLEVICGASCETGAQ